MKLQLLLFCLCVESFRNSEKCPSLFLAGNKRPVQKLRREKEKKMLQQDKNISASEKLRRKIQKQNS